MNWKIPKNINRYVEETLTREADDIPEEQITAGKWILDELDLEFIKVNQKMIGRHDEDPLHIKRKLDFMDSIKRGIPIYPLILLGKNLFLVDGYARYRALKELDIKKVKVIRQI